MKNPSEILPFSLYRSTIITQLSFLYICVKEDNRQFLAMTHTLVSGSSTTRTSKREKKNIIEDKFGKFRQLRNTIFL